MFNLANYGISAVHYNRGHSHIDRVWVHTGPGNKGSDWPRTKVVSAIERNTTFVTILKNKNKKDDKWREGQLVQVDPLHGVKYIRTVGNGTTADNLRRLPTF
jgi:hypothetical protein